MSRRSKYLTGLIIPVAVLAVFLWTRAQADSKDEGPPTVAVVRGELVDKALAVGTIEPRVEVGVKSILAGVIRRQFADVGDFVKRGDPLLEIAPNSTPLELVELRRAIELREIEAANARRELERQRELRQKELLSIQDFELAERRVDEAETQLKLAKDRLALQEGGRLESGGTRVETLVRAPIDGFVLEKAVEIGDPVVPLTPYQEGTVLMRMAAMKDLVFRGTVDEIDVGRLQEGMPVTIKIGALPGTEVLGRLDKIWLKGKKQDQATVFPIEISLTEVRGAKLRAGYSANAEVIVARRDSVLVIPERLLTRRGDSTFVTVKTGPGTQEERLIRTGLSDAIGIEVVEGLKEGDSLLEKPPREIK
jgi:HlyD family secretion protein